MTEHPATLAGATLDEVRRAALGCTLCPLATQGRRQVVFGVGDPHADLMFIGEGPGEQEDLQGEPFVGRAGKLLTQLIEGIGLTRDDVYIANVVKCRPPGNRDPLPVEIDTCAPWLDRQLELVHPKIVMTLGNFATKLLLSTSVGITKLRGQEFELERAGLQLIVIPTLHPSAVLRGGGRPLAETRADFVAVKRRLSSRGASFDHHIARSNDAPD
ncbi:MAG TPA: uracil-DNA glycosylase [Acidimicrobiia bacterium]